MPSGARHKLMKKSGIAKTSRKNKQNQRKVRVHGNAIIEKNWDHSLTMAQNYQRLGLRAKLGSTKGGIEKNIVQKLQNPESEEDAEKEQQKPKKLGKNQGRIIRDEDGNVVRVEYAKNSDSEDEEEDEWNGFEDDENTKTEVVKELESYASTAVSKPRWQSEREQDWISRLIDKHGEDYEAMFWDKELNIWQLSVGQIKRKIMKWKKKNNVD